ncbi:elongation factor Ts [bacterium]|mgnify:FL=1|jgi:translation elongation factor Ts|nr:elongation factor Ts [bacterium]MBD9106176.1 elongation factor Ts [bacterium]
MFSASDVKDLRERTNAGMMDCKKALEASNGDMDQAIEWLRKNGMAKAAKKEGRIAAEGITKMLVDGNQAVILEVNSETDFVAKNEKFIEFVNKLADVIMKSDATDMESALALTTEEGTVSDMVAAAVAQIGEKISFRRFTRLTKNDNQVFGSYSHMGGRIAALVLLNGTDQEAAYEIAMHAAAMNPQYVKSSEVPTEVLEKEKSIMREELLKEGKPADRIENILVGKVNKYYSEICLEDQIFIKAENKETVKAYAEAHGCEIVNMVRYEVGEGIEKKQENFAEEVMNQING